MSWLDRLLGRGTNPLAAPGAPQRTHVQETGELDPDLPERLIAGEARTLGVNPETLVEMIDQRELFVAKVQAQPRVWGFDLRSSHDVSERRSVVDEYSRATRLTGVLGASFLTSYEPLMAVVPNPLTMPDGTPLDVQLVEHAPLEPDAARDIAQHVRTTIQATLGEPLTSEHFEHAVREAAWDHEFDATRIAPLVLRAVQELL